MAKPNKPQSKHETTEAVAGVPAPVEAAAVRPNYEELLAGLKARKSVEIQYLGNIFPLLIAGFPVSAELRTYRIEQFAEFGESHMRALTRDERIHVRIVE